MVQSGYQVEYVANNFSWSGSQNGSGSNHTLPLGPWFWPWCPLWQIPQHPLFQLFNFLTVAAYCAPSSKKGQLWMHSILIFALVLQSAWAWRVACAPDGVSWAVAGAALNAAQLLHLLYVLRPVQVPPELDEAYRALFEPFKVSRQLFKRMVSPDFANIMSLHAGEAYAMQNLTKTDRLGLLLSGKVNVVSGQQFLHPIMPCEFLDSPEFESSRATLDEKFKVSIVAASSCRYIYWQRTSLEYLFVKETYLASVLTTIVARDITTKLYAMNNKIVTDRGTHLDIRLPSISHALVKSPRKLRAKPPLPPCTVQPVPPVKKPPSWLQTRVQAITARQAPPCGEELQPLAPSPDAVSADSGADTSSVSKYLSCEAVDAPDEEQDDSS